MGINAGTAYIDIVPKLEKFEKGLKNAGDKMSGVGKKLTRNLTLPIIALGGFATKAASDLSESMSKVDVVFGSSSKVVKQWSSSAATNLGISQQAALEAAGTYGNLFRAMKLGRKDATEMSLGLVDLSADLASFNNANPEDVLLALRAGLVGETEPLRKFGIQISAAAVEAEAMRLGLKKVDGELTAGAKAQASYAIIMKDSKLAQGDFARTSGGLANQQRILKAQLTDTAASIGTKLIPIGLKLIKMFNGWLDKFRALSPQTKEMILKIVGIAAVIGPLLIVAGKLTTALGSLSGGLAKTVTGSLKAYKGLRKLAAGFKSAKVAESKFSGPMGTLGGKLRKAMTAIADLGKAMWTMARNAARATVSVIVSAAKSAAAWVVSSVTAIGSFIATAAAAVASAAAVVGAWLLAAAPFIAIAAVVVAVAAIIIKNWDKIKAFIFKVWEGIKTGAMVIWALIKGFVIGPIVAAAKFLSGIWNGIKNTAIAAWNKLKAAAVRIWNGIKDAVLAPIRAIEDAIQNAFFGGGALTAQEDALSAAEAAVNAPGSAFNQARNRAGGGTTTVPKKGLAAGGIVKRPIVTRIAEMAPFDPEVVAPLSSLREMLGNIGGGGIRIVGGKLELVGGMAYISGIAQDVDDADRRFNDGHDRMNR